MDVFISWSGAKSRAIAIALRDWIPQVINSMEPFVSSKDIYAGTRWQNEIASRLDASNFGLVCVTQGNQDSPWLNFEAGALAKAVDTSRVIPLAVDLKVSDIKIPMGQFQAQPLTEEGISAVLASLNAAGDPSLDDKVLERATAKWWGDLEEEIAKIQETFSGEKKAEPERTERELLEETLNTVRSLARAETPPKMYGKVPRDHPGVSHLERLLMETTDEDGEIILGSNSKVAARTDQPLTPAQRLTLEEGAGQYGLELHFFPSRDKRQRYTKKDPPKDT